MSALAYTPAGARRQARYGAVARVRPTLGIGDAMSSDADQVIMSARYRKLAGEIRAELRMLRSPEMIEDLSLLADRYDALAEHLEAANSDNSKLVLAATAE
jgi:hypothetical protein